MPGPRRPPSSIPPAGRSAPEDVTDGRMICRCMMTQFALRYMAASVARSDSREVQEGTRWQIPASPSRGTAPRAMSRRAPLARRGRGPMTGLRSLQEHLNRWMLAYVSLAILAGLFLGNAVAGWTKANTGSIGGLTTAAVFLIIYPMMVNVRFEALLRAGRNLRGHRDRAALQLRLGAARRLGARHRLPVRPAARARLPAGDGRPLLEHGDRVHGARQG